MQAWIGLIKTMRPKQWTKNLLFVYPALVFDGQIFNIPAFVAVTGAFILLSMIAGAVYILNDLIDIESDRQHPKKRFRPLPSGRLPLGMARIAAVILPVVTIGAAVVLNWKLAALLLLYYVIQVAYSLRLKHIVLVDIFTVTSGFVLRVAAGAVVIEVSNFSPWLYICLGLLAMFLAIAKRRQELILLGEDAAAVRPIFKYYNLTLLDEMLRVITTSTLLTYILYTIETPSPILARTNLAVATVPFVMYGIFRYLYLIYVRGEIAPPDEVLLKDRPLQIDIVLYIVTFIVILYVVPR